MHPILGHFRRLVLYLAAWGPIAAILTYLFASLGGLSWGRAVALALPLCALYAFVCLSAWYMCRTIPVENSGAWLAHVAAAGVASLLWIGAAKLLSVKLFALEHAGFRTPAGLDQQTTRVYPILFGSGVLLYLLTVALFYILLSNQAATDAEKREVEARGLARESELKALKTQVNPHFIFNCLNSINRFILENNKSDSSRYLNKFSKLIRMILQNSQSSFIPLKSELESLELYMEMEMMRFDNHFTYKIIVPPEINISQLKVPPLILQPYVENAVWHGLMHKEEKGELMIEVLEEGKFLYLKITDNGIGRQQAERIASKSATKHKSMGLLITADRIAMMQNTNGNESAVLINDLVHADGSAAGTEVQIKIPVKYD